MPSADAGGKPVASDALVFFGATGDLAYKKIFPALQAMVRRGRLTCPSSAWPSPAGPSSSCGSGHARASRSTAAASTRRRSRSSSSLLQYVDGDYGDPATFASSAQGARRREAPDPLPGDPAQPVRRPSSSSSASRAAPTAPASWSRSRSGAISRPPRALNKTLHTGLPRVVGLPHRPLPRQGGGPEPAVLPLRQHVPRADLEPQLRRERADHDGREFGVQGRGKFYDETGAIRDVIQNHLLQVVGYLAMEPPISVDADRDPRRAGQGVPRDPPAHARGRRARTVPRLPRRAGRRAGLARSRPTPPCGSRSTRGAGRACRSSSAPASACR